MVCVRVCREVQEKDPAVVMQEVQAIIRQITASVTFLPLLQETCTIDLLAYTDKNSAVPQEWCVCGLRRVWSLSCVVSVVCGLRRV